MFASTSLFISLNSAEFCGSWIYGTDPAVTEPVLDLQSYILIWTSFQLLVTIYIAIFVPEGDPEPKEANDEGFKSPRKGSDGISQPHSPVRRSSSFRKKNKNKKKKRFQMARSPRHGGGSKTFFEFPDNDTKSESELDDSDSEEQETEPDLK